MKRHYLTTIVTITSIPLLTACSTLGESRPAREENQDPVAEIAMKYRKPSSFKRTENQATALAEEGPTTLKLGMSMDDVRSLWGEPRAIDTAGARGMGFERWTYFTGLSSRWALSSARVVYFENGHVAGWETNDPK